MRNIICTILVSFLMLFPNLSFGANIFVGIDETMPFEQITGIQFDVLGVSSVNNFTLDIFSDNDKIMLNDSQFAGASNAVWDFFKVSNPTIGVSGYDQSFGRFHLTPGIILGIHSNSDITLTNWIIMSGYAQYDGPFTISQQNFSSSYINRTLLEGGATLYSISAVPIPATALLFLSGIFGLVGIKRFKGRKLGG